jgi:hypothetical protein
MVADYTREEDKVKGIVSRGRDTYLCLSSPLMHPLYRSLGKRVGSVGTLMAYAVGQKVRQCRFVLISAG